MINYNFSNNEAQFLCDVCSIAVTNPICPACLIQEIEAWTTTYPDLKENLMPKLYEYLHQEQERIIFQATRCIKCNEEIGIVCPYCFTNFVFLELKKLKVSKLVLKEFLEFFNFDFDHTGYSIEAERLGVI